MATIWTTNKKFEREAFQLLKNNLERMIPAFERPKKRAFIEKKWLQTVQRLNAAGCVFAPISYVLLHIRASSFLLS